MSSQKLIASVVHISLLNVSLLGTWQLLYQAERAKGDAKEVTRDSQLQRSLLQGDFLDILISTWPIVYMHTYSLHRSAAFICMAGGRAGIFETLLFFFSPMYRLAELFSFRTGAHLHVSPKQSLCVVLTCPHEINITCKKEIKAPKHLRISGLCFLHIIP